MSVVEGFADLFEGRKDAYGTDSGGCCHVSSTSNIWPGLYGLWRKHLEGTTPIGVYPMVEKYAPHKMMRGDEPPHGWYVKWGCVDFDIKSEAHKSWDYETEAEAHVASVNLQMVLKHLGATSWIERTRSCGRHVWLFASTWAPAATMRHALLTACKVAGVSSREINPKQTQLGDGRLGNYVRIPYPGGLTAPLLDTQVVLFDQKTTHRMGVQWFVKEALAVRTSPQTLEAIASRYVSTKGSRAIPSLEFDAPAGDLLTLASRLTATGRSVFTNGPNDGDRSRGMVYLAKQAKLSGLGPHEAMALLASAHWNKYRGRADEVKQLRDIVERAWT